MARLPRDFAPRGTVCGYVRAWIAAGVRAHVHEVLYRRARDLEGRDKSPTAAIIGSEMHEDRRRSPRNGLI
jgi:putative transposase